VMVLWKGELPRGNVGGNDLVDGMERWVVT